MDSYLRSCRERVNQGFLKGVKEIDFICLINREESLEKIGLIVNELEESDKKRELELEIEIQKIVVRREYVLEELEKIQKKFEDNLNVNLEIGEIYYK